MKYETMSVKTALEFIVECRKLGSIPCSEPGTMEFEDLDELSSRAVALGYSFSASDLAVAFRFDWQMRRAFLTQVKK